MFYHHVPSQYSKRIQTTHNCHWTNTFWVQRSSGHKHLRCCHRPLWSSAAVPTDPGAFGLGPQGLDCQTSPFFAAERWCLMAVLNRSPLEQTMHSTPACRSCSWSTPTSNSLVVRRQRLAFESFGMSPEVQVLIFVSEAIDKICHQFWHVDCSNIDEKACIYK